MLFTGCGETEDPMRKLKLGFIFTFFVTVLATMGFLAVKNCISLPEATKTIGIHIEDDGIIHKRSVYDAMEIMNRFVGCEFLIPGGNDIRIMSTDGEPCGLTFHKNIEDGHSAGTYQCNPDSPKYRGFPWEVHVEKPGDIHLQVCIAAHEICHALGCKDKPKGRRGIMNPFHCPDTQIILSNDEVDFLHAKMCE